MHRRRVANVHAIFGQASSGCPHATRPSPKISAVGLQEFSKSRPTTFVVPDRDGWHQMTNRHHGAVETKAIVHSEEPNARNTTASSPGDRLTGCGDPGCGAQIGTAGMKTPELLSETSAFSNVGGTTRSFAYCIDARPLLCILRDYCDAIAKMWASRRRCG
jgi:hypothetical protein